MWRPFVEKCWVFVCMCVSLRDCHWNWIYGRNLWPYSSQFLCKQLCFISHGYSEPRVSDTIKLITQWELFHHSITFIAKNACIHIKRKTNRESIYMWMCGKKTANENRSTNISICTTIISYEHRVEKLNKIDLMLGWFTCVNPKENWL